MKLGKNIDVDCLYLRARAGSMEDRAIREAIIACLEYDVETMIEHNNKIYHMTPAALIVGVRHQMKNDHPLRSKFSWIGRKIKQLVMDTSHELNQGNVEEAQLLLNQILEEDV